MRRLAVVLAVPAALVALASCSGGEDEVEDPVDTAASEESPTIDPTEPVELDLMEAGGACTLIDSATLNTVTGADFRYASGGPSEDTDQENAPDLATCAVQTAEGAYPDLTLFVTGTEVSVEVYEEELPEDAEGIDVGEAGYWIVHTEDTGAGPALEMGWIDGGDVFEMRYTAPEGTEAAEIEGLVEGITDLAAGINGAHDAEAESDE
ncbi:hypothetical protein L0U85_17635 [Glycomyces sp. L485]|uniref:hypothetical protein n=1 Tax=Glycomyces sp. L485 TaxID=2909235 RepID=UPI001F4B8674|nr:hypothetical protein [Glycomyces sp. L485]MCH7232658.1 hypothetical protein [Glycomyces sp. L485]